MASATQREVSATQQYLSATQQYLSATQHEVSAPQQALRGPGRRLTGFAIQDVGCKKRKMKVYYENDGPGPQVRLTTAMQKFGES